MILENRGVEWGEEGVDGGNSVEEVQGWSFLVLDRSYLC